MDGRALDRRITLERLTSSQDDLGEGEDWAQLARVSASRQDVRDGERWRAQETGAEISSRFRVRYSTALRGLTPKDRLRDGRTSEVFDIVGVKELTKLDDAALRGRWLEISATARADLSVDP